MEDPDPNPTAIIIKLISLAVLILINAFFAMSETAIITLNDTKIKKMAEDGHKKAQKVLKLTANPTGFLSTIQIGITLAGFLASASAAESFSPVLTEGIASLTGMTDLSVIAPVATFLVTVIISYFTLVLGELVPKRIALQKCEAISFKVVGVLLFIKAVFKPFVKFLSLSTNLVLRLFHIDPNANEEQITEEEILMLVDAGEEKGVIEESQKEMINNIFEFDDITASDVMTHRTDIVAVEITDTLDDVLKAAINEGYSRIPVYEDELDNIKGILYVKDLLPLVGRQIYDRTIRSIMRDVTFVPESKRCGDLFTEMTESRIQMVVVGDEYGGVAGIVTIEDLLESIVGNIRDEYDEDETEEVERLNDTTITVDGTTDISDIEEELGVDLPDGEYDTIGGFIMSELGRIPKEDEHPEIESMGYKFTVVQVDERRIERVRIEKLPEPEDEEKED